MKAIVTNLSSQSPYFKYIGQTFEVKEVLDTIAALIIEGGYIAAFSFTEIFIVDIDQEIDLLRDLIAANRRPESTAVWEQELENLVAYCKQRNINI